MTFERPPKENFVEHEDPRIAKMQARLDRLDALTREIGERGKAKMEASLKPDLTETDRDAEWEHYWFSCSREALATLFPFYGKLDSLVLTRDVTKKRTSELDSEDTEEEVDDEYLLEKALCDLRDATRDLVIDLHPPAGIRKLLQLLDAANDQLKRKGRPLLELE
jgi:hypothetical protein